MPAPASVPVAPAIHNALQRITGSANDYEPLLEMMGDAPVVLLGEASHGTHEFYRERARITRRLFEDKEFIAVAVEADWPGAYRVNRWVRGVGSDRTAFDALAGFERFPAGCGVTGTCSPSSNGCAVTTTGGAPRPPSSD